MIWPHANTPSRQTILAVVGACNLTEFCVESSLKTLVTHNRAVDSVDPVALYDGRGVLLVPGLESDVVVWLEEYPLERRLMWTREAYEAIVAVLNLNCRREDHDVALAEFWLH